MGSWHATCAVSQLPIKAGTPIRIVFLQRQTGTWSGSKGHGFTHADDVWRPVSFPITGTYDDYGRLEQWDPNDWRVAAFLKLLREELMDIPADQHKPAVPRSTKHDLASIQRLIHDRMEAVKMNALPHLGKGGDQLGFCFIREDMFQGLVRADAHRWMGETITAKWWADKAMTWADGIAKEIREADKTDSLWSFRIEMGHRRGDNPVTLLDHFFEPFRTRFVRDLLASLDDVDPGLPSTKAWCYAFAEFIHFNTQFNSLGKMWMPQMSGASRDTHKVLARLVLEAARAEEVAEAEFDDVPEVMEAFWSRYAPPIVSTGTAQRFKVEDIQGEDGTKPRWVCVSRPRRVDLPEYACLFVVDHRPGGEPTEFTYVLIDDEHPDRVWVAPMRCRPNVHTYMTAIPHSMWPER